MAEAGPAVREAAERGEAAADRRRFRWTLRAKLMASFLVVDLLVLVVGAVAVGGLRAEASSYALVVDRAQQMELAAWQLNQAETDAERSVAMYLLTGDPSYQSSFETAVSQSDAAARQMAGLATTAEERRQLGQLQDMRAAYHAEARRVLEQGSAIRPGDTVAMVGQTSTLHSLRVVVSQFADGLVSTATQEARRLEGAAEATTRRTTEATAVVTVAAMLVALAAAFWLSRLFSTPLRQLAEGARRVGHGELDLGPVTIRSDDETGDLARSFARMVGDLRSVLAEVRASAERLAATGRVLLGSSDETARAAADIGAAITRVAATAGSQAESVESAARAVAQLREAINQIAVAAERQATQVEEASQSLAALDQAVSAMAESGEEALSSSGRATQSSREGGEAVSATLADLARVRELSAAATAAVQELGERSEQVGRIVETVAGLAEQTKLLALNAAIEAARAGEHGRGFAVVAQEVRALAQRSAEATREIGDILASMAGGVRGTSEAIAQVDERLRRGAARVDQAQAALGAILAAIEQTDAAIRSIAARSEAARQKAAELKTVMEGLAAMAEENASAAEEMAASAGEVGHVMGSLIGDSQATASASEEVSSAVEELEASSQEVRRTAADLAALGEALQAQLGRFRLEREAEEAAAAPAGGEAPAASRASVRPA
ncbi:MAG: methyl-accepting chemotaxis protein [Bacillota bacterium]|nr:methyl-accepting chemotaxis protein [Bacillota bacterium]